MKEKQTDLLQRAITLINEFLKVHGKNPTTIHIPLREENEMILLEGVDFVKGPRATFKHTFLGLKVVWNAKEFKVE